MKKVFLFTILILNVLSSCRIAKNVPSGYYLLHENEVKLQKTSGSIAEADLEAVIRQQSNQTLLGIPIRLAIFNAVDSSKVAGKRQNKNLKLMLFGIIIVLVAVAIAILLNKAKLTKLVNRVEEAVAPAIEEAKEVVEKAAAIAPKNETIKKAKEAVKKAPASKSAKKSK